MASERPPPSVPDGRGEVVEPPVVAIGGRIGGAEIAGLCARVRELFVDEHTVVIDVRAVVDPDIGALDALGRLRLTAIRMGREIKVRHTCEQFEDLAAFAGLREVLLGCDDPVWAPGADPR